MKLFQFRITFYKRLQSHYPDTEIAGMYGLILEKYMGISRVEATLQAQNEINPSVLEKLEVALCRLEKQEPIQYIIGEAYFRGLRFYVNSSTLIPRPETEELVSWIVSDNKESSHILHAVDIGTGSGCIALALKNELQESKITAIDISDKALEVVKRNAENLNLSIETLQLDILNVRLPKKNLDFIVSNPPYVCETEKSDMRSNVLDYEPSLALFVKDSDPLLFYRRILELATESVKENGSVYFEINERFAEETIRLADSLGWRKSVVKKDIFGRDRMMRIKR